MTTVDGETKTGAHRVMDIDNRGDRVLFWIHTPGDTEGGYEIRVTRDELLQKLQQAGLTITWR